MSTYNTNEASFEIPDDWGDQSLNVFAGPTGLGFVVSRDELGEQGLDEFVAKHLTTQSQKLRGYRLLGKRESLVGNLPAIEAKFQWRHERGVMFHHQAFLSYFGTVVTYTASSPIARAEACEAQMAKILGSMRFRKL